MGLLYGRETADGYEPSLWHRWFKPEVSGNTLNGLGETSVRRPTRIYHRQDFWHPWRMVQDMFYIRMVLSNFAAISFKYKSAVLDRQRPQPIGKKRTEASPGVWSKRVKDYAKAIGVDKVGIVEVRPEWIFEGDEITEKYAIILATRMDYEALSASVERQFSKTIYEVMSIYFQGHLKARQLANWLRKQGWDARGYGTPMGTPLNLVPAAQEAGIGTLGKHGSLISKEMGSLLRLAYVLTDMPMATDGPEDIGADEFCASCQRCTDQCPPKAITDRKQMVRGVERWYVDFDKCVPYFNEHGGCAICLAVCPWSQPGVSESLVQKMLRRKKAA